MIREGGVMKRVFGSFDSFSSMGQSAFHALVSPSACQQASGCATIADESLKIWIDNQPPYPSHLLQKKRARSAHFPIWLSPLPLFCPQEDSPRASLKTRTTDSLSFPTPDRADSSGPERLPVEY
jgi:hypothetical protein